MLTGRKKILIGTLLVLISLPLQAQTPGRGKLPQSSIGDLLRKVGEVDSLSTSLQRLHRQQQLLSQQADSLAREIQLRKQKAPSMLQDRALNTALRFSQALADSLQRLQEQEQRLDRLLRQKAEQLLGILNGEIERLVKAGENLKGRKKSPQREQLARELLQYREWQQRCQELLEQPPPPIIIYEVEVHPNDSPETLRRKADFLHDQADRLQREVKRLNEKIAEIRDETEVKARVADLVSDISLFDPNREAVPNPSIGTTRESEKANPRTGLESGFTADASRGSQITQLPVYQNWPTNLADLSLDELKRWQEILQQQKKRRQAQADSLKQRAEEIERRLRP